MSKKMNDQGSEIASEDDLLLHMTEFLSYNISHFERDIPKKSRDAMIRNGINVARSYGFTTEHDISQFIAHMMTINPCFYDQPHIHAILTNLSLPPNERLQRIVEEPNDAELEESARMVNPAVYWARVLQEAERK